MTTCLKHSSRATCSHFKATRAGSWTVWNTALSLTVRRQVTRPSVEEKTRFNSLLRNRCKGARSSCAVFVKIVDRVLYHTRMLVDDCTHLQGFLVYNTRRGGTGLWSQVSLSLVDGIPQMWTVRCTWTVVMFQTNSVACQCIHFLRCSYQRVITESFGEARLPEIAKYSATKESELAKSSGEAASSWSSASDTSSAAATAVSTSGGEARLRGTAKHGARSESYGARCPVANVAVSLTTWCQVARPSVERTTRVTLSSRKLVQESM